MKACLSSFILIIYFTLDYFLKSIFILDLVGVSCSLEIVHVYSRVGRYQQYLLTVYLDNEYLGMTKILTKCRVS